MKSVRRFRCCKSSRQPTAATAKPAIPAVSARSLRPALMKTGAARPRVPLPAAVCGWNISAPKRNAKQAPAFLPGLPLKKIQSLPAVLMFCIIFCIYRSAFAVFFSGAAVFSEAEIPRRRSNRLSGVTSLLFSFSLAFMILVY